jgi:phospholipid/cholesterol/gamma-HCH transport system substrate-binding protein
VNVRCLVDLKSELPIDTRFQIKEKSMMGGHLLEIIPGNSDKYYDLNTTLSGEVEPGLFAVVNQASGLISDLEQLLWRLNKDEGMIQNLEESSSVANKILKGTDALIKNNKEVLTTAIGSFNASIHKIDYLLSQNVENIDQTLSTIPRVVKDAESTLADLKGTIAEVEKMADSLNSGNGSAGKLLTDEELYNSLKATISEADSLLQDIKKHPRKYLKISVF